MQLNRMSDLLVRRSLNTAQELREQLLLERTLLHELAKDTCASFSLQVVFIWEYRGLAVVLGRNSKPAEVKLETLRQMGGILCRRETGGCSVVLQPGILCCSALVSGPAAWPAEWQAVHRMLADVVRSTIRSFGRAVEVDESGDFRWGDRKVGGTARRDLAGATLWHASLICGGMLERFDLLLNHPPREPAYRRGRRHLDFVAALGVPVTDLAGALERAFRSHQKGALDPSVRLP